MNHRKLPQGKKPSVSLVVLQNDSAANHVIENSFTSEHLRFKEMRILCIVWKLHPRWLEPPWPLKFSRRRKDKQNNSEESIRHLHVLGAKY